MVAAVEGRLGLTAFCRVSRGHRFHLLQHELDRAGLLIWGVAVLDEQPLDRRTQPGSAGRDLDEAAVWLGNVVLASALLPWWARVPPRLRRLLPALLHVGDGLQAQEPLTGAVLMNPPYGRIRLDHHERLRCSHAVYGHANWYGLFMAAGAVQLRQAGWVAATSSACERTSQPKLRCIGSLTCGSAAMFSRPGSSRRPCWPLSCAVSS